MNRKHCGVATENEYMNKKHSGVATDPPMLLLGDSFRNGASVTGAHEERNLRFRRCVAGR